MVVDNGSTDATPVLLQARLHCSTLPLVVVTEPTAGISRARNAGLRHARGRIICFTDDDCYPAPDFLTAWHDVFQDMRVGYAGGRVELFDPDDADVTTMTDRTQRLLPSLSLIFPGTVHGCCMAFRREVIKAIGGFDTRLGGGTSLKAAEDSEYVQRASARGFTGIYSPAPTVWHHDGRKAADVPTLTDGYERGEGAFYACLLFRGSVVLKAVLREVGALGLAKASIGPCTTIFVGRRRSGGSGTSPGASWGIFWCRGSPCEKLGDHNTSGTAWSGASG